MPDTPVAGGKAKHIGITGQHLRNHQLLATAPAAMHGNEAEVDGGSE